MTSISMGRGEDEDLLDPGHAPLDASEGHHAQRAHALPDRNVAHLTRKRVLLLTLLPLFAPFSRRRQQVGHVVLNARRQPFRQRLQNRRAEAARTASPSLRDVTARIQRAERVPGRERFLAGSSRCDDRTA